MNASDRFICFVPSLRTITFTKKLSDLTLFTVDNDVLILNMWAISICLLCYYYFILRQRSSLTAG